MALIFDNGITVIKDGTATPTWSSADVDVILSLASIGSQLPVPLISHPRGYVSNGWSTLPDSWNTTPQFFALLRQHFHLRYSSLVGIELVEGTRTVNLRFPKHRAFTGHDCIQILRRGVRMRHVSAVTLDVLPGGSFGLGYQQRYFLIDQSGLRLSCQADAETECFWHVPEELNLILALYEYIHPPEASLMQQGMEAGSEGFSLGSSIEGQEEHGHMSRTTSHDSAGGANGGDSKDGADLRAPPTGTPSADGDSLALLAEGDQDDEAEEATAAPEQEDAVEEEDGAPQESNMKLHTVRLNSAKDFQDFMHLLASELTGASQKPKADPAERLREQLVAKGAQVWPGPGGDGSDEAPEGPQAWEDIGGYAKQKRQIEEALLLLTKAPDVLARVLQRTRRSPARPPRPRAMLLYGEPGTGKTMAVQVLARQSRLPLVCLPLHKVVSSAFGEAERTLASIFELSRSLSAAVQTPVLLFLDEVDSLAPAEGGETPLTSQRLLATLLAQIDGPAGAKGELVVLGATNRLRAVNPALRSRFEAMIHFPRPTLQDRQEIIGLYAAHLSQAEVVQLAQRMVGLTGRDIRDVCQQAERTWVQRLLTAGADIAEDVALPRGAEYLAAAHGGGRAVTTQTRLETLGVRVYLPEEPVAPEDAFEGVAGYAAQKA
eukprot:EG_transcript_4344